MIYKLNPSLSLKTVDESNIRQQMRRTNKLADTKRAEDNSKYQCKILYVNNILQLILSVSKCHYRSPASWKKRFKKMSKFLGSTVPKVSNTHCVYIAIYFLYLLAASTAGIVNTFEDTAVDPMMQPTQKKVLTAYFAL